jgi:hypothetical protein
VPDALARLLTTPAELPSDSPRFSESVPVVVGIHFQTMVHFAGPVVTPMTQVDAAASTKRSSIGLGPLPNDVLYLKPASSVIVVLMILVLPTVTVPNLTGAHCRRDRMWGVHRGDP